MRIFMVSISWTFVSSNFLRTKKGYFWKMTGCLRNQILLILHEGGFVEGDIYERFRRVLKVKQYFNILETMRNEGLIDFDHTKTIFSTPRDFIYPSNSYLNLRLTPVGRTYTKRALIDLEKPMGTDRLDFIMIGKTHVNYRPFEGMSFEHFCEKHLDIPRASKMDKRIAYYIATGINPDEPAINKRQEIKKVIEWLVPYSKAHDSYVSALKKFDNNQFDRSLLDDLRFSMEQFLKEFLQNDKPVEKQNADLKKYLKEMDITPQVTSMYDVIYSKFCDYQNKNVKHGVSFSHLEVEFVIEITSSLMRLLLRTKN